MVTIIILLLIVVIFIVVARQKDKGNIFKLFVPGKNGMSVSQGPATDVTGETGTNVAAIAEEPASDVATHQATLSVVTHLSTDGKPVGNKTVVSSLPVISIMDDVETVEPQEDQTETFYLKIAGISFHCDEDDAGAIAGRIMAEPSNEQDPEAMAIMSNQGKVLGYVPAYDLVKYRRWCGLRAFPFIGYILNDGFTLSGRLLAIRPLSHEFVVQAATEFEDKIRQELGDRYVAKIV